MALEHRPAGAPRTFDVNPATLDGDLALKVAIDNDVDVFFNGVLIASNDFEGCGQEKVDLRDPPLALVGRRRQRRWPCGRSTAAASTTSTSTSRIQGGADPEEPPDSAPRPDRRRRPRPGRRPRARSSPCDGSGLAGEPQAGAVRPRRADRLAAGRHLRSACGLAGLDPDAPTGERVSSRERQRRPRPGPRGHQHQRRLRRRRLRQHQRHRQLRRATPTATAAPTPCSTARSPPSSPCTRQVVASGTVDKVAPHLSSTPAPSARDLDPTSRRRRP